MAEKLLSGTVIGPIALQSDDDPSVWSASVRVKKEIYGKRFRIAVGGKSGDSKPEKRNDTDTEPVFFWAMPGAFYEELLHRFFGKVVLDLTPGPGTFGEIALKHRIGYYCLAMSEKHAVELEKKFRMAVLKYLCEEGCPLYNPKCAEAFGSKKEKKDDKPGKRGTREGKADGEGKKDDEKPEAEPKSKRQRKQQKPKQKSKPEEEDKGKGGNDGEDDEENEGGDDDASVWDLSDDDA